MSIVSVVVRDLCDHLPDILDFHFELRRLKPYLADMYLQKETPLTLAASLGIVFQCDKKYRNNFLDCDENIHLRNSQ